MPSRPPIFGIDNQIDRAWQYPAAVIDASSYQPEREPWRVVDGRREDTWWQPSTDGGGAGNWIRSNLGVGNARGLDYVWWDRGSNLWGKTVKVELSHDGATWPLSLSLPVPALGTIGGDSGLGVAVTEEGACYALLPATGAYQYRRFFIPTTAAFIPVVTGLMMGVRYEHFGYSNVYDPDEGERTEPSDQSQAGRLATGRTYHWRTLTVGFGHITKQTYAEKVRQVRRLMFELNAPVFAALNAGDHPERAWLYQYRGTKWSAPAQRVLHSTRWTLRELNARVD